MPFFLVATVLFIRWIVLDLIISVGGGHLQSLTVAGVLFITGVLLFAMGIIGDALKTNRMLLEDVLYKLKKREFETER